MKPLLIISRHGPAHDSALQALHYALATASLDIPLTVLWMDDGCAQLDAHDTLFARMLQQLELFDDIQLLCESPRIPATTLPVTSIDTSALPQLVREHRTVMVY